MAAKTLPGGPACFTKEDKNKQQQALPATPDSCAILSVSSLTAPIPSRNITQSQPQPEFLAPQTPPTPPDWNPSDDDEKPVSPLQSALAPHSWNLVISVSAAGLGPSEARQASNEVTRWQALALSNTTLIPDETPSASESIMPSLNDPDPPEIRRDSVRPRQSSTTSSATLSKSLDLLTLAIAALHAANLPPSPSDPPPWDLPSMLHDLHLFILEAWTEETLTAELEKAREKLPRTGAEESAELCVGFWLADAVRVLREGGLKDDAGDLEGVCREVGDKLRGLEVRGAGRATGDGRMGREERW